MAKKPSQKKNDKRNESLKFKWKRIVAING
jgi:hypothetical protein